MTTLPQTAPVRMPRPVVPTQLAMPSAPHAGMSLSSRDGSGGAAPALTAHDMWRIIRGNIWLIIIMVLVSGVAGYGVNSYLARYHSQYTAKAYVLVRGQGELPRPGIEIQHPQPSEIELLQNTQTAMLTHEGLFMEAIQNPESRIRRTKWFQEFGQQNLDLAKEDLAKKFRVTPKPGSKLIQVEMTFSDPDDTKVIVEDMVFEHIKNVKDAQVKQDQDKVKLLGRELAMVKIELDTEVSPHILSKEKDLGADEVATFTIYNGKQIQLDRLSMERSRIAGELSGVQARLQTLVKDLEEGRTPAEVEREINRTGRYVGARQQVDDIDIVIDQLTRKFGPAHDQVIGRKQLRATLQAKVDEIREELKSNYAEMMKNELKNDEMATQANAQRVDRLMDEVSKQLSELNQKMSEYKTLKEREKELRERIRDLNEEMTKINQFHINAPWAAAEWGSRPQKPDRPSFPKLPYTMGVALALGLALSLGIAFLREMTDTSVRSPRDIARVGQMNLLGMIPHDADDPQSAGARLPLVIFDAPQSIEAEAFRQVRTRLQHSASLDTVRSILVTSPSTGDGKTTVACNLAAGLAQNGRRILLVDANFRKPQLHTVFGVPNDMGLSDALQDPDGLGSFVRETEVPNLSVMTSGPKPANATELLESQLQTDFIDRALEEYDHVVFDSGPLLMVADSIALAPRVDGVVTVVRARGNSRGLLMRMRDELKQLKAEHLGVILNAVRAQGGGYYGRNIQAYYRYQNEE